MKKIIILLGVVLLLLVIAVVVVAVYLDRIVLAGIGRVAPGITQTTVTLEGVSLSPLSGAASLKGLVIGNPSGNPSASAIRLARAAVRLEPASILHEKSSSAPLKCGNRKSRLRAIRSARTISKKFSTT